MVNDGGAAPTFGLWYDFRQKPPLEDYASFWARLPRITHEQGLRSMHLFASEVAPRVRESAGT